MSIRNLDYLFKPRSVAVIGASREPRSLGAVLAHNLLYSGFQGPIMPVNPRHRAIEGVLTYPDVESLPMAPDLAVIATPRETVPGLIDKLGRRGTRAAVIITAGFHDRDDPGAAALRQEMLEASRPYMLRIVGPNCTGVMVPSVGLNAGVAHVAPKKGHLAFVAQSGAVVASVLDWATARDIGFSCFASLGDMADVDFGDLLDYLTSDPDVRGILLYMEAVTHARKFMSAARAVARLKPVIVVKAGRFPPSARAVSTHTGALAGKDAVFDAAFRRAGMLRVADLGELFGAVETLGMGKIAKGERLAILTNGGGAGVMAADALIEQGGCLANLAGESLDALDRALPSMWSRVNPVDILDDASGDLYAKALTILLNDANNDAVLVLNCPTAITSGDEAAKTVIKCAAASKRPVLTCWLGEHTSQPARRRFAESRMPTYLTPEAAVRAFMNMVDYRRSQEALTQTPPSIPENFEPATGLARAAIETALAAGREWLTEPEVKTVLQAYFIPTVPTRAAADPRAAATTAAALAGPVALKILSPDIIHKSDVGGVALNLRSPQMVRDAAQAMLARVQQAAPHARLEGFTVQPMVERPDAVELIMGVTEDPQFGPILLFGSGGTATEIVADTALALPPLNMHLALDAMRRTKAYEMLQGFRGRPAASTDDVALTLIKISQLVVEIAEVVELDINPLLADEFGVLALDARIRVRKTSASPTKRLAIRPYPKELEETIALPDGRIFLLRPVLPEDEPGFYELFDGLSSEDIRMRFFAPKKALSHPFAARLTQIDYDREMALVLAEPGTPGKAAVFGAVHIAADPDGEAAEYAIMLRSDMAGLGFGPMLMRRIIDYGRLRGLKEIFGEVLRENHPMLRICDALKFKRSSKLDDPGVIEVRLKL